MRSMTRLILALAVTAVLLAPASGLASKFNAYRIVSRDSSGVLVLVPGYLFPDTSMFLDSLRALLARNALKTDMRDSVALRAKITAMADSLMTRLKITAANDTSAVLRAYARTAAQDSSKKIAGDSVAVERHARSDSLALRVRITVFNDSLLALTARIVAVDQAGVATLRDSVEANTAAIDSSKYYYGIAGDTTSPGLFYRVSSAGLFVRVDTSLVPAAAVAVDSVNKGALGRFQYSGIFGLARWLGRWGMGVRLFSDSTTAGEIGVGGQAAPKKMQAYGTSLDSTKILLNIDQTIAY